MRRIRFQPVKQEGKPAFFQLLQAMEKDLEIKRTEDQKLQHILTDVILDRAVEFDMGGRSLRVYPSTLGKMLTLGPHIRNLGINQQLLSRNPYLESLRLAKEQRKLCCHILSWHCTPNSRERFQDTRSIESLREAFQAKLSDADLAALMLHVLASDQTVALMSYLGLDAERARMSRVLEAKKRNPSGSMNFGGLSIFGSFIGPLKEMGYTDDEIIYEKGYCYLRLMLADKMTSVYLTDEERSELTTDMGGTLINGDDPNATNGLLAFFAERGIKINS